MRLQVFSDGWLIAGANRYRCALGPAGVRADKREGDGATPAGAFPLRRVLYRADRRDAPETPLPTATIAEQDGWCDAPEDPAYNQPVVLPYPASAEALWRDDHVYDVIVVLGHNDAPPQPGAGSAVFFHLARPDYAPTEGCIAVAAGDMEAILAACGPDAVMEVRDAPAPKP